MTPPRNDDPDSLRGMTIGETALLRRELDRQYTQRLQRVEDRLEAIETTMGRQLHVLELRMANEWQAQRKSIDDLLHTVQTMAARQTDQLPTIETLERIVHSGMVLRWMILAIVGTLGALATVVPVWETAQRWFVK